MDITKYKYHYLFLWILALQAMGALIGFITGSEIHIWYATLQRSPLSPPDYVFGIVWTVLYLMIAVCGWQIWRCNQPNTSGLKTLFIAQLLLNWLWSPLFFSFHQIALAFLCLLLIVALVITLISKSYHGLPTVSLLLIPYLLWLLFAGYLNFYIWAHNVTTLSAAAL